MADYRQSGGTWIVTDGPQEYTFSSEQEARTFMANKALAMDVVKAAQGLGDVFEKSPELITEWYLNPPTEEDCLAMGTTLAALGNCVTFLEQFGKFMNGDDTMVDAQYKANFYAVKRVQA